MPEQLRLIVGQRTDPGLQRKVNEDSLAVPPKGMAGPVLAERGHLYVVADGIGGQSAGATASRLAVETVQREYYHGPFSDVPTALARAIEVANQAIQDKAQEPGLARMGTTLVAAVVRGAELTVAHVGDSRAYLASQTGIHQLTEDHTWVAEQQRAGVLTEEEARQHSQRHIISRSLGKAGAVPDITQGPLQPGDAVLLCTDGLSNLVSAAEMHQLLASHPPQTAADQLVGLANQRGGPDNVTALVVQVGRAPVVAPRAGGAGGALSRLSKRLAELPPKQMAMAVAVASMAVCLMTAGVVSLLRGPLGPAPTGRPAAPTSKPTGWIPPSEGQATERPSPTVEGTSVVDAPLTPSPTPAPQSTPTPTPTPATAWSGTPIVTSTHAPAPTGAAAPSSTAGPTHSPTPSNIGVIVPYQGQGDYIWLVSDPDRPNSSGIIRLFNDSTVEILGEPVLGDMVYGDNRWYPAQHERGGVTHVGYVPVAVVDRELSRGRNP